MSCIKILAWGFFSCVTYIQQDCSTPDVAHEALLYTWFVSGFLCGRKKAVKRQTKYELSIKNYVLKVSKRIIVVK